LGRGKGAKDAAHSDFSWRLRPYPLNAHPIRALQPQIEPCSGLFTIKHLFFIVPTVNNAQKAFLVEREIANEQL
jgi:hypothetical protein